MPRPNGPPCPKCGAPSWDNRANKTNPKAPDFKCAGANSGDACRDEKNPKFPFGWWDDDDKVPAAPKPAPEPARASASAAPRVAPPGHERAQWAAMARVYDRCVAIACKAWPGLAGSKDEGSALVAAAATLFIQAQRSGLVVEAPAPAAKKAEPAAPPPPPRVDDYPEALAEAEAENDGLPF